MSQNTSEHIFQNFCALSQQVQAIETAIQRDPITLEKRAALHRSLESLQGSMEKLRQGACDTQKQAGLLFSRFEDVESQIVSLYRKVEEGFEEYEISEITKEAFGLTQSLSSGKMAQVAKQVDSLKHNVLFLFKHRKPSMQHRRVIHLALKLVDHSNALLSAPNQVISKENLQLIQLLKSLLKEAVQRADQKDALLEAGLSMDLYEIAELLYHKKEKEGRLRLDLIFTKLSKAQQARLRAASDFPKEMVQILLEIADGDPCIEWAEKEPVIIPLMQA